MHKKIEKLLRTKIVIILALCVSSGDTSSISLSDYVKTQSTCTNGYIANIDKIVYHSNVSLGDEEQADTFQTIYYQLKQNNSSDYKFICDVPLLQNSNGSSDNCYCLSSGKDVAHIILNITALSAHSGAYIRGVLVTAKGKFYTEEKLYPIIYVADDIPNNIEVIINSDKVNATNCYKEIKEDQIRLDINCLENPILPCNIELVLDNDTFKSGTNVLNFSFSVGAGEKVLIIKHEVCRLNNSHKSFSCNITVIATEEGKQQEIHVLTIWITVSLLIVIILVIVLIILYKRKKNPFKLCNTRQNVPNESSENEPLNGSNNSGNNSNVVESADCSMEETLIFETLKKDLIITSRKAILKSNKVFFNLKKILFETEEIANMNQPSNLKISWHNCKESLSPLKVKVTVSVCSPQRPKFWPGSKNMYPLWKAQDRGNLATGQGFVINVFKNDQTVSQGTFQVCRCKACNSENFYHDKSKVWAYVSVYVKRHLVFDDFESKSTTISFACNTDASLDVEKVKSAEIQGDWCFLRCITCDMSLIERLVEQKNYFHQQYKQLYQLVNTDIVSKNKLFFDQQASQIKRSCFNCCDR